ncbi:hypothetical protein CI105_08860 [Candidatus Izimaplasma bacterium ZiA1]|uniref:hypothetical protein n=1 Tax=Candidatus Izimoplasma sp. ZiA1 TaxID=2024899 RepID=UPI000BAA8E9E|nr:hypothetical protein CI105_08860 [Candidatus Izimaplasma bacterium ZiA1]
MKKIRALLNKDSYYYSLLVCFAVLFIGNTVYYYIKYSPILFTNSSEGRATSLIYYILSFLLFPLIMILFYQWFREIDSIDLLTKKIKRNLSLLFVVILQIISLYIY